jgi:hypothetical protein
MPVQLLTESLRFVPTTDPTSVHLPEDPFRVLFRPLGPLDLQSLDEKWPADRDEIQLLRKSFTFSGNPRTERCWDDEKCMTFLVQISRRHDLLSS